MNEELKKLVLEAGAPKEVMNDLWFNVFCIKFADLLLTLAEEAVESENYSIQLLYFYNTRQDSLGKALTIRRPEGIMEP